MKNNILQIFQRKSKFFYAFLLLLGLMNSVVSVGLLLFINSLITGTQNAFLYNYGWLVYSGLILSSLIVNKVFQTYLIKLTNNILWEFEVSLLQKLRMATYESYEKLGSQRVFTAINDTRALARIPNTFIAVFNAAVTATCCLIYLFISSVAGGATITTIIVSLFVFYMIRNKMIKRRLDRLRDLQNHYYKYLHDLLLGFKEIKMSTARNENIFKKFLLRNRTESRDIAIETSIKYLNNELTGSYGWYLVLGLIIFALPALWLINPESILSMIIIILYIMAPVSVLISTIPSYTHIKIAYERLVGFEKEIDLYINHENFQSNRHFAESKKEKLKRIGQNNGLATNNGNGNGKKLPEKSDLMPMQNDLNLESFKGDFTELELVNTVYQFKEKNTRFLLGPINITFKKGETVFITGGNGSGKTTLVNILTGLYKPTSGEVLYNGQQVYHDIYPIYMNLISVIFTNHHMFNENYDDFDIKESNETLGEYVSMMKLSNAVQIMGDNKGISNKLSKGQQKRLSMIYALMEQRDLIILDEWAAEQDPQFRSYFYKELLPKLKAMGKTIIAVTHDDEYYDYADRIIRFDYGQVISDEYIELKASDS